MEIRKQICHFRSRLFINLLNFTSIDLISPQMSDAHEEFNQTDSLQSISDSPGDFIVSYPKLTKGAKIDDISDDG